MHENCNRDNREQRAEWEFIITVTFWTHFQPLLEKSLRDRTEISHKALVR